MSASAFKEDVKDVEDLAAFTSALTLQAWGYSFQGQHFRASGVGRQHSSVACSPYLAGSASVLKRRSGSASTLLTPGSV